MRWQIAWMPCFLFLGGCFTMPSCEGIGCEYDADCGDGYICGEYSDCQEVTLCESSPCPDGATCVTRPGSPAGNPFESADPGKKVCRCPGHLDFDLSWCVGVGGEGGYGTGATGGGGTGGGTGGGNGGGMAACESGTPTGDIVLVEKIGGTQSEGGVFLTSLDTQGLSATVEAITFQGSIDFGGQKLTSAGAADVAVMLSYSNGETPLVQQIGGAATETVTAIGQTDSGKGAAVAMSFSGVLNVPGQSPFDAGAGTGALVIDVRENGMVGWYPFYSDGTVTVTGVAGGASSNILVVAGTFTGTLTLDNVGVVSTGGTDGFIAAIDTSQGGKLVWHQQIGGSGDLAMNGLVGGGPDARLFAFGQFDGESNINGKLTVPDGRDGFVLAIDTTGQVASGRVITGPDRQEAIAAAVSPTTGNLIVTGARGSESMSPGAVDFGGGVTINGSGQVDMFLAEYTPDLALGFVAMIPGPGDTGEIAPRGIAVDCAGQVTIVGQTTGGASLFTEPVAGYGKYDAFVCKIVDSTLVWAKVFGGPEDDQATSVTTIDWNNIVVGGTFTGAAMFENLETISAGAEDAFRVTLKP